MKDLPVNQVLCGDAFSVLPTYPKESIDMIIIDPPFYLPIKQYASRENKWKPCLADFSILEPAFSKLFNECKRLLKAKSSLFVFCDCISYPLFFVNAYGLWDNIRALIWYKGRSHFPIGTGQPFRHSYEVILHAFNSNPFFTMENRQDVLTMKVVPSRSRSHPAQKPIPLLMHLISACSRKGDIILDPMCGSGSTLVASAHLNRKWIGIDLNSKNVGIAQRRLSSVKSQKSLLEGEYNH